MGNLDYKFLNKLIKYGSFILISLLLIIIFYYTGIHIVFKKVFNAIIPVFFAVCLSFFMEPIILFFNKRKCKRFISVLLSYFILILIISLILLITLPSFISQLEILINDIPHIIDDIEKIIINFLGTFGIKIEISNYINNSINDVIPNIPNVIKDIFSIFTKIGIIFIGALYLSFDYPKFKIKIKSLIPTKYKDEILPFLKKFQYFSYKYIYGLLIDALILWALTGVGFAIVNLKYAIVFGFIIAIFDLIPYIGPIIGGAPAVIVAFTKSPKFAIIILAIVLIAQFIESHITQPLILKSVISLHPIEGMLGVLILGSLFGFSFMILSPIIVTLIKNLIPCIKAIINKKRFLKNNAT